MTDAEFKLVWRAKCDPDRWVVRIDYSAGTDGAGTRRVISPIRIVRKTQLLALCLAREQPRLFAMDRISNVHLVDANDVLMPVQIEQLTIDS